MTKRTDLIAILAERFGETAEFFVDKEMDTLGITDLDNLTQNQKKSVITLILIDLFKPVASIDEIIEAKHRLCKLFDLCEQLIN